MIFMALKCYEQKELSKNVKLDGIYTNVFTLDVGIFVHGFAIILAA